MLNPVESSLSPQFLAPLACLLEACARKAGNVHPDRDFTDLRFGDFLASALAIGPAFQNARIQTVGQTIFDAIVATRRVAATNTNLGMVMLLAPLAAVPAEQPLRAGIEQVLKRLTVEDARLTFAAIRLARPGGMGAVKEQDIAAEPTVPLGEIMRLAADRDAIARQYVHAYEDVFAIGLPALSEGFARLGSVERAIVYAHLKLMAGLPDSLIARKRGQAEALEASRRAATVLVRGWPASLEGQQAFRELDGWLTEVGNGRNPGTSADLVTACLYAALRDGIVTVAAGLPWSPTR